MRMRQLLQVSAFVTLGAFAATPPPPPPPSATIPDPKVTRASVECVLCDQPFDTQTHEKLLAQLLKDPYAKELRNALYMQDIAHQFESKAHFDNCDFDGAMAYLESLLAEVEAKVTRAVEAKSRADYAGAKDHVKSAYFALGQAIHGVQDFYAHSNYVEQMVPTVKRTIDIPLMSLWTSNGKLKLANRRAQGLESGVVWWGLPQLCRDGALSHGDLAKDSESTGSGNRRYAHLENQSGYQVAVYLAREDSLELMRYAFKRWPILKDVAGPNIILDVLVDRRM